MATPKSPFYIIRNFLSPLQCEATVSEAGFYDPDIDPEGNPLKMTRHVQDAEKIIYERYEPLIPKIEEYYEGYSHKGTERMSFEYYPQGCVTEPLCENSNWLKRKWVRTKDRDISAILFLSTYNKDPDFEQDFEVYGGKLGFHNFKFSFQPERGTLIFYPSGPHFINSTSEIYAGDLFQVRFHLAGNLPYLYQPVDFPGDYRSWFNELM